jgi:23S rRNA (pseudouridine1915-N3)-methyltransferase
VAVGVRQALGYGCIVKIRLLSVGTRMPAWVRDGFEAYTRRLPKDNQLLLEEIARPSQDRDVARTREQEWARMLARIKPADWVVALDERGESWTTAELSQRMADWRVQAKNPVLLIGGPDGLASECLARADSRWSLSALTLPHALVRVVVAEQIYRAWTLLSGHPYHRS